MTTREPKLTSINISKLSYKDLIKFIFNRSSLHKLYKVIYNLEEEEVTRRKNLVISNINKDQLEKELRLCYKASMLTDQYKTYTFNKYIISLIEMHYSDIEFQLRIERDIQDTDITTELDETVSYSWVLFSNTLNRYQRYLLFELLVLGYNTTELARRRYCTPRTIYNHFDEIVKILSCEE